MEQSTLVTALCFPAHQLPSEFEVLGYRILSSKNRHLFRRKEKQPHRVASHETVFPLYIKKRVEIVRSQVEKTWGQLDRKKIRKRTKKRALALKVLSTTAKDDTLKYFFLFFQRKQDLIK